MSGGSQRAACYGPDMQRLTLLRILQVLVIGYVVLALVTRAKEAVGAYTCACDPGCWCKTPGLSFFRWVFPRGHRNRSIAAWKTAQDTG